jgi:hypothetical protein
MSGPTLKRATFVTSRLLEFTSEKELALQTGHPAEQWACVVAKELGDNSLDAAEEADVAPDLSFTVNTGRGNGGITVTDNAKGIPADTVAKLLDFSVRVSSREAYVAPTRGAQGNALKTIIMMPFVLGGEGAEPVVIEACGIRHNIGISVDAVKQQPVVVHEQERSKKKNGTAITVPWPNVSFCSHSARRKRDFYKLSAPSRCSIRMPASASTGTASAPSTRPSTPISPSGGRATRHRLAGMTLHGSSASWRLTPMRMAATPFANSFPSFAGSQAVPRSPRS